MTTLNLHGRNMSVCITENFLKDRISSIENGKWNEKLSTLPIISIREIENYNVVVKNSILLQPSRPVSLPMNNEEKRLLSIFTKQMLNTMEEENGIGLAAVQVNIDLNIFVVAVVGVDFYQNMDEMKNIKQFNSLGYCFYTEEPIICINPEIVFCSEQFVVMQENCLSVRNEKCVDVPRPRDIIMHYIDINGKKQILRATGWLSRCIQHEYDHLLGKVIEVKDFF